MREGTDIEHPRLDIRRMVNILTDLYVDENLQEKEYAEARDKARAMVLRAFNGAGMEYDYLESGSYNDDPDAPLPDLTPQTDNGYLGLDPPLN